MAKSATEKGHQAAAGRARQATKAKAESRDEHVARMREQADNERPSPDSITDDSSGSQVLVVLGAPNVEVEWRLLHLASGAEDDDPITLVGVRGEQPDPTPLTPEQLHRLTQPGHDALRAKALKAWIVDGKTMGQQIKEGDLARDAKRNAEKTANRSAAQKAGRAQTAEASTGEQESTPFLPDLVKGKGYFAWAVLKDTEDMRFLGFFEGDSRQRMAKAAREELRRQLAGNAKGSESKYRIVSARPNHVRVTPNID